MSKDELITMQTAKQTAQTTHLTESHYQMTDQMTEHKYIAYLQSQSFRVLDYKIRTSVSISAAKS